MAAQRQTKRVDLENLFRWRHELEIRDHEGTVVGKLHQRILNERDVEQARLAALRATRELRLALRNSEADEYAALQENLLQLDREQRLNIVMLSLVADIYDRARKDIQIKLPNPPTSDASLEEVEEYEHAVDTYEERVNIAILDLADKYTKAEKAKIDALDDEELDVRTSSSMENQICMNLMTERFLHEQVWRSVYYDAKFKQPYFSSYDGFDNLAAETKEQLVRGYKDLELNRGQLKN